MFMNRFIPVALTACYSEPPGVCRGNGGPAGTGRKRSGGSGRSGGPRTGAGVSHTGQRDGDGSDPGMTMGDQGSADKNEGMAMEPGMQGPGKEGCRMGKGGMKGMMHGGMGKGGMMGGGMEKGGKMGCRMGQSGITQEQYRELIGRLDVLDARMAKIDAMLERLLER